jgi:acyl carrier protein
MDDIETKVHAAVTEFAPEGAEVTNEAVLVEDLTFDSLDNVELAMAVEDAFPGVTVEDDEMARWKTVADVVNLVRAKVGG